MKLPEPPSIHTVRGNIVHSVLEKFFDLDPITIAQPDKELLKFIEKLLDVCWIEKKSELQQLNMTAEELNEYYVDSRMMVQRWLEKFLRAIVAKNKPFPEAFIELKPTAEEHLISEDLGVQGYIDALYQYDDGRIKIVDYKTSRKDIVTPEYNLQAGIYAVLVHTVKGTLPESIEFDFLKGQTQKVEVNEYLINNTKFELEQIHVATATTDVNDYPRKPGPLCKWSNARGSGQCAFFEICKPFGN